MQKQVATKQIEYFEDYENYIRIIFRLYYRPLLIFGPIYFLLVSNTMTKWLKGCNNYGWMKSECSVSWKHFGYTKLLNYKKKLCIIIL